MRAYAASTLRLPASVLNLLGFLLIHPELQNDELLLKMAINIYACFALSQHIRHLGHMPTALYRKHFWTQAARRAVIGHRAAEQVFERIWQ